jgi:hypothetical protein
VKKKSQSKGGARKKAKKRAVRDLQALEPKSRRVVGGRRDIGGRPGIRI